MRFFYENGPQKETVARQPGPIRNGSSGVPGSWCWVVRGKLLFSNDLWRKAGHSVYRTQVTEIKRLTMNLREQPPGTPEEPTVQPVKLRVSPRKWSRDPRPGLVGSLISAVQRHRGRLARAARGDQGWHPGDGKGHLNETAPRWERLRTRSSPHGVNNSRHPAGLDSSLNQGGPPCSSPA